MGSSPVTGLPLKGLFDKPILNPKEGIGFGSTCAVNDTNCDPATGQCIPGFEVGIDGYCAPLIAIIDVNGNPLPNLCKIDDPFCDQTTGQCRVGYAFSIDGYCVPLIAIVNVTGTASNPSNAAVTVNATVNNAITVSDNGIQLVAEAVKGAISSAASDAAAIAKSAADTIGRTLGTLADNIATGVSNALGNIGSVITQIAKDIWNNLGDIIKTVYDNIKSFIKDIGDFLTPILHNIADVLDTLTKQVQQIYDQFIFPLLNFYQTTVVTIANLTQAIENDLKNGITGLLAIPGQLVDALGSIDATLDRTVQQLGTVNSATVHSAITFAGDTLPGPIGAAMAASLGGTISTSKLKTTFNSSVVLSTESLQQVAGEAGKGLGTLLSEVLNIIMGTFSSSFDQLHADWTSVGSVFVGLLDGIIQLLATTTAMAGLAEPLIQTAKQEANKLIPSTKLDVGNIIEALNRGILSVANATAEMSTHGLDSTRQQVLVDLSYFLADVNTALDWYYRGIIAKEDLTANLTAHGIQPTDQEALIDASVYLPSLSDLLRWLNWNIISQDEFTSSAAYLHYDPVQIQTILETYRDPPTPQLLAQLDGLLNNSGIGWLQQSLQTPIPDSVTQAGNRANLHPAAIQYLWLAHWNIPSVDNFIQAYFRGYRTLTEVQSRMAIENIPPTLWQEMIDIRRPLIPFRSLGTYYNKGALNKEQVQQELSKHGFSLENINVFLSTLTNTPSAATATAAVTAHSLSLSNAEALWGMGALTDAQYTTLLEAHGYTPETAALTLQAQRITEHVKQQRQTLADYTALVETGNIDLSDATTALVQAGFTAAQVSKWTLKVSKSLQVNTKHPSLPQLLDFLKEGYISLDQYTNELQIQGWADPWLAALTGIASKNVQVIS